MTKEEQRDNEIDKVYQILRTAEAHLGLSLKQTAQYLVDSKIRTQKGFRIRSDIFGKKFIDPIEYEEKR